MTLPTITRLGLTRQARKLIVRVLSRLDLTFIYLLRLRVLFRKIRGCVTSYSEFAGNEDF